MKPENWSEVSEARENQETEDALSETVRKTCATDHSVRGSEMLEFRENQKTYQKNQKLEKIK